MRKLLTTTAALLVLGGVAWAGNTVFFTNNGDIVFPFSPPASSGAAGLIDNMTIGATTPRAATFTSVTNTGTSTPAAITGGATPFPITGQAAASATAAGGAVAVAGAAGGATSGTGGAVSATGGAGTNGNAVGGAVSDVGGAGQGSAAGGAVSNTGGAGGATGAGGASSLVGGVGGATSGSGGNATVTGGAGSAGNANGGSAIIGGGAANGSGVNGAIFQRGVLSRTQSTPAAKTTSATLTATELLSGIITVTNSSASAQQAPTGTAIQNALPADFSADDSFDVSIINLGSSTGIATLTVNTDVTIVGNAAVPIPATGVQSSCIFRFRKTGDHVFVAYRVS